MIKLRYDYININIIKLSCSSFTIFYQSQNNKIIYGKKSLFIEIFNVIKISYYFKICYFVKIFYFIKIF